MSRLFLTRFFVASVLVIGIVCSMVPPSTEAAPNQAPGMKFVPVFGQKIAYIETGSGPDLVLLHGLGSSADGDWGRVIPELAKTHHVLALDLLGFGSSDKPMINYGIQTWVDTLGEFLREKNVTRFTLMGESLGGWIAANYTAEALQQKPDVPAALALPKPSRLVLSDAAGRGVTMRALHESGALFPIASLASSAALQKQVFASPEYQTVQGVKGALAWSMGNGDAWTTSSITSNFAVPGQDVDARLKFIVIPTLVVWGERDQLLPRADADFFTAGITGARLVIVPGAGHAPMIETPSRFLDAVQPFLNAVR
jgi:pimeloyl-ACP methyl ester carboxylesterase